MSYVRYGIRTLVVFVLCGFYSCNWIVKDDLQKRNLYGTGEWFYKECHTLDSLQIIVDDTSLLRELEEEFNKGVKVMNHYEPMCQLVDSSLAKVRFKKVQEERCCGFEFLNEELICSYTDRWLNNYDFSDQFRKTLGEFFVRRRYVNFLKNGYNRANFVEIKKRHSFVMKFPDGFEIIRQKKDFIWVRTNESNVNAHFFVYLQPYVSEGQFELEYLVKLRDSILKKHVLYKNYDSTRYSQTELYFPLKLKEGRISEVYSYRIDGSWSINKKIKSGFTMGGPFLGFALVGDQQPENFYYIEAFFSAANEDKLPFIRTLEAILRTFELHSYE